MPALAMEPLIRRVKRAPPSPSAPEPSLARASAAGDTTPAAPSPEGTGLGGTATGTGPTGTEAPKSGVDKFKDTIMHELEKLPCEYLLLFFIWQLRG